MVTTATFRAQDFADDIQLSTESLKLLPDALSTKRFLDVDYAFARGAFASGGAVAQVELYNMSDEQVVLYDMYPINIVRECMPLAALLRYGTQGGELLSMGFNLDAGKPIAMEVIEGDQHNLGDPYFEKHAAIKLLPRKTEQLFLNFSTSWGAYSFEMAVKYSIKDKKHTAIFDNSGTRFRVASNLCPPQDDKLELSNAVIKRIRSLRFQNIRARGQHDFSIDKITPEEYAQACFN